VIFGTKVRPERDRIQRFEPRLRLSRACGCFDPPCSPA
jgi:hypothetical protein